MSNPLLRRPSAFLPILMSLVSLALVLGYAAMYGGTREYNATPDADEGTAAHIFQLLMGGQVPVIAFFAATALPAQPARAFAVLGLQLAAGLAAFGALYVLEHS